MDSTANIYICNNMRLMIDFTEKSTTIDGLMANGVLLG